jgi:PBP1b-binding outer membrane lipoprotein LpoB
MRGKSGLIAVALSALVMGGCATRPAASHDGKDNRYENTDRPIVPYENDNRPIMALDFGTDDYAVVRIFYRQERNMEIDTAAKVTKVPAAF